MQIRARLTIRLSLIVTLILVIFSSAIYFIASHNREDSYYKVLKYRALTEAKLYSKDVKEVDTTILRIIDKSRENSFNTIKVIAIYEGSGKLVYKSPIEAKAPVLQANLCVKVLANKEIKLLEDKNQAAWEYYEGSQENLLVYVNGYDTSGYEKLRYLAWVLLICCIAAILVTFIFAYYYPIHLLAPINYIIDLVEEISSSSLNLRLPVGKNRDEIDRLAITFNNMLHRLEESFEMKRDFISNASHEMRTPLGIMMVQIEVALLKDRTTEEYKKTLASILEDMKNLRLMMNGLIELTEANMQPGSLKLMPLHIDELLWEAKVDLLKQHPEYEVIENYTLVPEDHDKLFLRGNELLKIAFMNIMSNGCKYSKFHRVSVSVEINGEEIIIIFKDKGMGIPQEEIKNVLHPFYRGSNAKVFPGNGLGLALSLKIIELHGGELRIDSKEDEYTTVTIVLPKHLIK